MIRRHRREGRGAEIGLAVERAAIEQHLPVAGKIGDGRDHAAAAGFPARDVERVALDMPVPGQRLGIARPLGRIGQEEFGRGHAERIEQVGLLELVQRLARGDLDDAAEHVDRMAVIPQRARLFGQRHLGDPFGEFGIVEIAEIDAVIGRLDQPVAIEAVGDAGGVQQQILDIDRPARRHQVEHRLAGVVLALDADLHVGKGRNVFADGIVERDLAAIDQHHRRHAGDGLGDRMDREDRIRRHRRCPVSGSRLPKHLR